jgi:hypothetical protein
MNRRLLLWPALCIVAGLSACTTLQPSSHLEPSKACADWRWIGIKNKPETPCPSVPGWTVSPLFTAEDPKQTYKYKYDSTRVPEEVRETIPELQRFCVYEIKNRNKKLGELPFPPAVSAELVRFDQDCAGISPSGGKDLSAEIWEPLAKHFLSQAGRLGTPPTLDEQSRVRLAFLDTQPTGKGVPNRPGNSLHGYTLAHIARHLVCTPESDDRCAAEITTRLALPIIKFHSKDRVQSKIDTERGGFFGLQGDLAEAIEQEVNGWQSEDPERHLVLNLSLAWDGALFGGLDEKQITEMRAGAQAVYQALRYASGYGALVLSAAGNQKNKPCLNSGPLLPAAWEKGHPDEEACNERREAPLLYAVGGVQSNGRPLENARHGGMPRRAAYGENAVVASWNPQEPTGIFTGSSVATAVVSSIAAVVWDLFPTLDAHEVMSILDRSGDALDFPADFWFGASAPPQVHRLSLCAALRTACEATGSLRCPLQYPCPSGTPYQLALASPPATTASTGGSCQPWLLPQPEDDPCPTCPPKKQALTMSPAPPSEPSTLLGFLLPAPR